MLPVGLYPDACVVEPGTRKRIEREGGPVEEQNACCPHGLDLGFVVREQEEERISEADLRQRVFECEIRLFGMRAAEEDAEKNEPK